MKVSPEQYQELLDGEEWSPAMRAEFQYRKAGAEKRERQLAAISERTRQEMLIAARQAATLRSLKKLLSDQFEVAAWRSRVRIPLIEAEARNRLLSAMRGMKQRLAKARRESAEGWVSQTEWLELHAELIAEVERIGEQPGGISKAALHC